MDDESNKNLHIVLVHGTWGRGLLRPQSIAPWCQEGSSFRNGLLRSFQESMPNVRVSISAFNWSGANSILERAKAAQELVTFLGNIGGGETVLIVAHSHGGNVAIRAVGKLDDPSRVYLCTLATPFFRLFESSRQYIMSDQVVRILSVASVGFVTNKFYSEFLSGSSKGATVAFFILNTLVCVVGGWKLGGLLHKILVNPPPKFGQKPTAWQLRPQLLCEAAAFDAVRLGNQLLILRGVDDEAAMSLAMGAVTNRILKWLYDFMVTPGVHFAFLIFGVSLLVFGSYASSFFVYGQFLIFGIAAFALASPSIVRIIFGRELAFGVLRCDATYDSAPDSKNATIETLLSETIQSKRTVHAIYENPAAPNAISKWASTRPALLFVPEKSATSIEE